MRQIFIFSFFIRDTSEAAKNKSKSKFESQPWKNYYFIGLSTCLERDKKKAASGGANRCSHRHWRGRTALGDLTKNHVTKHNKLNLLTGWRWSLSLENIVKVTLSRIWGIISTQTSLVTIVSKSTVLHPHKCCIATPSSMEINWTWSPN